MFSPPDEFLSHYTKQLMEDYDIYLKNKKELN